MKPNEHNPRKSSPRAVAKEEGSSDQKTFQNNLSPLLVFSNSLNRILMDSPELPLHSLFPFLATSSQPEPPWLSFFKNTSDNCPNLCIFSFLSQRKHLSGRGPRASHLF